MPPEAQQLNPVLVNYLKEAKPEQRKYVFSKLDSGVTQDKMAEAITQKYGAKYGGEVKPLASTNKPFDTGSFYESLGDKNPLLPTNKQPQAPEIGSNLQSQNPQARQITPQEQAMGAAGYGAPTMAAEQVKPQMEAAGYGESPAGEFIKGAGKGVLSTVKGASELGEGAIKEVGQTLTPKKYEAQLGFADEQPSTAEKLQGIAEKGLGVEEGSLTTPTNTAQKIGFGTEQLAEFFIPGGASTKVASLVKDAKLLKNAPKLIKSGAELLAKAGTEATLMGGITKIHGGTDSDVASTAAISAAIPIAGAALAPVKKFLTTKLPAKMVNTILRPSTTEFNFGKNPGQGIVNEGITANTREGLLNEITAKKKEVGKLIDSTLKTQGAGKTIDVSTLLSPLDDAMEQAVKSGEQTLYNRLQSIKDGLTKTFKVVEGKIVPVGERNLVLTPEEAALLKREIGNATKWTNQAFDTDVNQVRVSLYRNLNDAIDAAVPGSKALNSRYANLLGAEKSLDKAISVSEKHRMLGLTDLGVGAALGAGSSIASGDSSPETILKTLLFAGLSKGANTAAVKTNMAKMLNSLKPEEAQLLSKAAPILKNLLIGIQAQP